MTAKAVIFFIQSSFVRTTTSAQVPDASISVRRAIRGMLIAFLVICFLPALPAQIPEQNRREIDQITGTKGVFVPEEGSYKVILPREAATVVLDYETLPSTMGLNSWAAFSPAKHHGALLTGELLLLGDEVDSVINSAVNADLQVTGLADTTFFDGPALKTLDVSGVGTYEHLAAAFRRVLDEIQRIAKERTSPGLAQRRPSVSLESSVTPEPLDEILSMHGEISNGIYRASVGRMGTVYGESAGREMGLNSWISISGTDEKALAHGEIIATADELRTVLRSLSLEDFHVIAIRNHFVAEHPAFYFVRFWKQGRTTAIAHSLRSTLEAQIGVRPAAEVANTQ